MAKKGKPSEKNRISSHSNQKKKNAKSIKYVTAEINKTQQNCKCMLCGERDETIDHIRIECNKLAQKVCKTRHDCKQKEIYRELCQKLKTDYTNKWYMHKLEFVQENGTHKFRWDFEI